jgi:hypothetical protein
MEHFTVGYTKTINEMLHRYLISTWHYKHQVFEINGLMTALLINYDDQKEDEFIVNPNISWEDFLIRMSRVKPDWAYFDKKNIEHLAEQPHKTIGGWEGRTIYFIRGGSNPEFWSEEKAMEDALSLISSGVKMQGPMLYEEAKSISKLIPSGLEHYRIYENFCRISINYLFNEYLGEAKAQDRTEPGNDGTEIRDILAQNRAQSGVFYDLKMKYSCSEILFEAKNKSEITRDDLRQVYCYLKPAIGLWAFIVCRAEQPENIHAYNRTVFKNFTQTRGLIIINDKDIEKMIEMKIRGRDPADYIQEKMSKFIRSI